MGHVHHQRDRARRRHAARPLAGRLRDGAEGPREAGLHRQPDAGPRQLARARDRQEGQGLRPDRPQAQAAGHGPAARDGLRRGPADPRPVRQLALHPQHDRGGHRGHEVRGGRARRAVQEAAPGRAAVDRQRAEPAEPALLRPEALRPHARRPLQAELAPAPGRVARHQDPHPQRHHRARQGARLAAEDARHPRDRRGRERRADQGLRRRGRPDAARADRRAPRRVRALRQPPPAHRRRADPGGLPDRPLPDGARRPRAPHHRGLGHDHAADDHQHPPGRRRAEGVLRLEPAVAVHGPDELAHRPDAPPPPVGARRRRPHARARADRGARRAPHPLRPHVPDRDAGGPEHRPDRLALELRRGLRARLRHDALPARRGRRRHEQDRPPGRQPGGGEGHRAGERADRPEDEQAQGPARRVPRARGRARARRAEGRRPDGRLARPDLVGRDGADPVPRARRRQPRADGLEHAAPGRPAAEDRRAADRHRAWSAARRWTRATWSSPRTTARSPTSTPSAWSWTSRPRRRTSTTSTSTCARTRARSSTRSRA